MTNLIYPKLSYQIVGILFSVHNELGYGLREETYQKAIASALKNKGIPFKEKLKSKLLIGDRVIKNYFIDFLIDDKIVLEIKAQERFYKDNIAQVYDYLKSKNLKLGIIANFTKQGVKFKRIVHKY